MRLLKRILKYKLLVFLLLSSLLTGCAGNRLTVYPIRDTDIRVTDDEVIMSKWYFQEVLKVKLEKGR
jgi:hypothetical protein